MYRVNNNRISAIAVFSVIAVLITFAVQGCSAPEPKKGGLQICDTDIKSKCSGECIDGFEPRYYFDSRNIQTVKDETDRRIAFLKKQGLGDLDDYEEILNNEKKSASFAKYSPPECTGCKAKFTIKGSDAKCEEFYQYIETLNQRCGGCVEIVPDKIKKK